MKTAYTKRFGIAVIIAALAGGVSAFEPNSDDANLLRGPEVVESSGPDSGDTMTGQRSEARPTGDMPFRAYLGAVRGLHKAAQDNPELALTDEQKEEIRAIGAAHKEKMKAFMEEHREELAELRGKRGEHRQQGKRGQRGQQEKNADQSDGKQPESNARDGQQRRGKDAGDQAERKERAGRGEIGDRPSPEQRQKMRERMAELMATAPSDQDAKKQLWAVLTPEQQAAVKANISDMRAKRQARVDEAMDHGPKGREGKKGKEGKKGRERKGESQGMIDNPIFEIDEVIEMSDDC